jgi:inorganic pyrophosphatase
MKMNLWHDIPIGKNLPESFNTIIEIPKGSNNKYEIDKDTGLIALDRANYDSSPYPFDYGFVPQTLWEDGDPLDVVVISTYPLHPGILVEVRPVGVIRMIDEGESDYKIISVPIQDKRWDDVKELGDINKHRLEEYKHFFLTYKTLNGKDTTVEIDGIGGKDEAIEAINKSIDLYQEKYGK